MARALTVALAGHALEAPSSFADWTQLTEARIERAVARGAELLVFAEYGALELCSTMQVRGDREQIEALQAFAADYEQYFSAAAKAWGVTVVAPSFPLRVGGGRLVNRTWVVSPSGTAHVDKMHMTQFEVELGVEGVAATALFSCGHGRFGVATCYDIEFADYAAALVDAGAELVVVPSCTETWWGAHRVRVGARARALENQVWVGVAVLRGESASCGVVDVNVGEPAMVGPIDAGFSPDGVVAQGVDASGWLVVSVDLDALTVPREQGSVRILRDRRASHPPRVESPG